jgi:hypothetical protein
VRKFNRYELKNPNSAQPGIDGFSLRTIPVNEVKQVTNFSKTIMFNGEKTQGIETDHKEFMGDPVSSSFRSSAFFSSLEEEVQTKFVTYMTRFIGALTTIENSTLAASQTIGEGSDTSHLSSEEKEARKRLVKAERRLRNLFKEQTQLELPDFSLALNENEDNLLPQAVDHMNDNQNNLHDI